MIYLDNAATSGKKPPAVIKAVNYALHELSANPGRGGHKLSIKASELIYSTRKKVAEMFGADSENQVAFTPSCTYSLNFAIKGTVSPGDNIIISSLEHNASFRPAFAMKNQGVSLSIAEVIFADPMATVRSFERLITEKTKAVVCTHASNVTGEIMPIEHIGRLCKEKNITFIVDAAQSGGVLPIDMEKMNIDILCLAPHKGLYAPMGCGIIISKKNIKNTIIEGGTGVLSALASQPLELPERLESGTLNLPGIAGISEGISFVNSKGISKIYEHELLLTKKIYSGLLRLKGISFYTPMPKMNMYVPVLSFNIKGISSAEAADILNEKYNIAVRPGLHCAPLVHKRIGTISDGTIRVSTGLFNTEREVDYFINSVDKIIWEKNHFK